MASAVFFGVEVPEELSEEVCILEKRNITAIMIRMINGRLFLCFFLGGVSWSGEVTSSEDASDFVPAVSFLETGVDTGKQKKAGNDMTYQEMMENAKLSMGLYCKACPVCDGRACKNQIPGPGAKGVGDTAIRNYKKWQEIRVNMDTICDGGEADTSVNLFGKEFKMPFFAGPVGAVNLHYSDRYDDVSYNNVLVSACADAGIAAFTGDGVNAKVMEAATEAIRENDGCGIPTVKPWNLDTVREKMELVKKSGAFAVAMDIDAAGLPFLKNMNPPAGSKNVQELSEIVKMAGRPFIVKGVMTAKGARKAKEAGADAIIVSNHGGRVLDQCPATAEVLEEIVKEVNGSMKILVDGGIRSGTDIFKALALGADGVLICRPFVVAVYGGGEEGVKLYIDKLGAELKDAMQMCGAHSVSEITRDMVRYYQD